MKKCIIFPLIVFAFLCQLNAQNDEIVAFRNVNIIPMNKEVVLKNRTVLVSGEKIISIGKSSKIKIPENAKIIEGKGKYLMPGLGDMHVHIWHENDLMLYLANGVTTVRNMNGRSYHLVWRDQMRSEQRLGPDLYTTGPTLYGRGGNGIYTPENGKIAVQTQKKAGYDFIKIYHLLSNNVYDAILAEAKLQNIPVVGHKPARHTFEHIFNTGQVSMEHLLGYAVKVEIDGSDLRAELIKGNYSYRYTYGAIEWDKDKLEKITKLTAESGIWNCPTLIAMDRWVPKDSPIALGIKEKPYWKKYISPKLRNTIIESYSTNFSDYTPERRKKGMKFRRAVVSSLHKHGAKLILGTDAGAAYIPPGFSIVTELQNLVEAGLSPYEAIKTGTKNVAELLGKTAIFGTIEKGKRADFILLYSNPLKNVKNIENKIGVMVKGKWLSKKDLDKKLDKIEAAYN